MQKDLGQVRGWKSLVILFFSGPVLLNSEGNEGG